MLKDIGIRVILSSDGKFDGHPSCFCILGEDLPRVQKGDEKDRMIVTISKD
ncbi:MAG: hypothetical protein Q4A75_04870 [Peptostreptococcaceae bacterium]|nr:hypothetical protein [Peptostreptococcaceae bacterium]